MKLKKKVDKVSLEEKGEKFRQQHNIETGNHHPATSDHFLVEIMRILGEDGKLLADDTNQAFSQLNMGGKLKELFATVDETKEFALTYNYALHPLDDIQKDLADMKITQDDGTPITFKVDILQEFVDEWMRKRVPANRLRVEEFIRLKQAVREFVQGGMAGTGAGMPREPGTEKRRIW